MNTIQTREIMLDASDYGLIREYLSGQKRLPVDRTVTYTAQFDDGYEMDVKCCGGGDDCAWTEAVLFKDGCEVCFTEPGEDYLGLWEIEANGKTFITNVSLAEDPLDTDENTGSNRWLVSSIFREMLLMLPTEPNGHFWAHENMIMCDTSKRAEDIADFLNTLRGKDEALTAYYDENESGAAGYGKNLIGWHGVWLA